MGTTIYDYIAYIQHNNILTILLYFLKLQIIEIILIYIKDKEQNTQDTKQITTEITNTLVTNLVIFFVALIYYLVTYKKRNKKS